ncbi:hypothetical protein PIB30_025353 [Stylosanthes scabra]|uniref:Aminotransferase-like plant mobile domain-containing protein n=1 Tax=Stylosanthes scabra TaxID=79078 RepID=A0ABU6Y781_9FABA|nr:hypothetical protein [Stylosanthes scabra]
MEDLSMFQRPRTVALEYENPGTYGMVLIYPLNCLVECGFVGDMAVNPWVGIVCRRQAFARESESLMRTALISIHDLIHFAKYDLSVSHCMVGAMLYFWNPTTNCLHLPCGIVGPTLFEVAAITGLASSGVDITYESKP